MAELEQLNKSFIDGERGRTLMNLPSVSGFRFEKAYREYPF
ncbi:hypothetical protein SAMN04488112_11463 [Melghirimyces thermohalophilus]|uniref:Uncharacterized protein n=1 Tax=Melghirimyces thermohalophilus TaxID=1236220 RepID=A0A1G6NXD6_9BACL|nr:hypothetical protein SAMN04488112_11463 [Melghirimyces thermohalophilus]